VAKARSRSGDGFEDSEIFSDQEFEVDTFVRSMDVRDRRSAPERAAWQRVEDWKDRRELNEQLSDWDDWDG
jgi:hypothetical protein